MASVEIEPGSDRAVEGDGTEPIMLLSRLMSNCPTPCELGDYDRRLVSTILGKRMCVLSHVHVVLNPLTKVIVNLKCSVQLHETTICVMTGKTRRGGLQTVQMGLKRVQRLRWGRYTCWARGTQRVAIVMQIVLGGSETSPRFDIDALLR